MPSVIETENTLIRHEEEIKKLNEEVFGHTCTKFIAFLGVSALWIIIYMKAFGKL